VSAAISWDPKVQGMKRIQASLNLKMKDYVFIDDREDERELMHMTYPEILCLDATAADTWRRFDLWSRLLEEDLEMDRTLMYKQREARKAFIKEDVVSDEERAELFESLQLKLDISEAAPDDLKRIAELINRTNQFNLEGSRTSFREVTEWHESPNHLIVIGQTADRFGDMGTTCVAVAHIDAQEMRLLPFVLSCRVFGYGIEHGVMDYLKGEALRRGATRIVGRYLETPQNAPCKDFLAESGFVRGETEWSLSPQTVPALAPKWLAVTRS
jgi:FkbH-like protein